ncbi:hypothetical protein KIW84_030464 [Lathyrus oleraceus]|uniref:Uncharacterized protein n=1 Tax=Pisum sativum TaxID=3888 RepID=A0A9D5AYZ6_PEA|nr:hypothetical protein KIW84_030464 [Pisum sativum]
MKLFFYPVFGGLAVVVAVLELSKNNKDRINTSPAFNLFKNDYHLIYSLMMDEDLLLDCGFDFNFYVLFVVRRPTQHGLGCREQVLDWSQKRKSFIS